MMKKLFLAIRHGEIDTVRELLDKKPELIACTAKAPPKKDEGQSPLQVALKTQAFEIVDLLLDRGADVRFMEADLGTPNDWRAPVVHDAIIAAVMSSRWNTYDEPRDRLTVFSTADKADRAYGQLQRILEMGADVNALDSFGNPGLWRFASQAAQILPSYDRLNKRITRERLITEELRHDLSRISALLTAHGADPSFRKPALNSLTLRELEHDQPVLEFLP